MELVASTNSAGRSPSTVGRRLRAATVMAAVAIPLLAAAKALAAPVSYGVSGGFEAGPLAGLAVTGTVSVDESALTAQGVEYLPLASLSLALANAVILTREDIYQGGQMLYRDGVSWYFTAAFPRVPGADPVPELSALAFGFGGPGVIGYRVAGTGEYGQGVYAIAPAVPEPSSLALIAAAATAGAAVGLRRRGERR